MRGNSLQLADVGIDEDSFVCLLGMQSLALLHHDEGHACAQCSNGKHQSYDESCNGVHYHEAQYANCCSDGCPSDVASLESHKLQWALQSLEHWVLSIGFFRLCHSFCLRFRLRSINLRYRRREEAR